MGEKYDLDNKMGPIGELKTCQLQETQSGGRIQNGPPV
jgi:hypothetical protein